MHPVDWVVTLPSQDVNGEDGTIQAGEYGKGDTATFYVYSEGGKVAVSKTISLGCSFIFAGIFIQINVTLTPLQCAYRTLRSNQKIFSRLLSSNQFPRKVTTFTKISRSQNWYLKRSMDKII